MGNGYDTPFEPQSDKDYDAREQASIERAEQRRELIHGQRITNSVYFHLKKQIDKEIETLNEEDANAHIWWNKFNCFLKQNLHND